jgi:hypothetical protein
MLQQKPEITDWRKLHNEELQDHLEDMDVDGRIRLKWILKK